MLTTTRTLSRVAVLATAGALALTTVPAQAASTIDTWSTYDGSAALGTFGQPNTATYGQTITIPAGDKKIANVTWYMGSSLGPGELTVRTGVYTWDGSKAGTQVAMSKSKTIAVDSGGGPYEPYKFKLKKAKVKAGQQYVAFATISLDYEKATPNTGMNWPVHTEDELAGGNTVWINDGGDESQWTSVTWSGIPSYDMAFQATLK